MSNPMIQPLRPVAVSTSKAQERSFVACEQGDKQQGAVQTWFEGDVFENPSSGLRMAASMSNGGGWSGSG